LSAAQQAVCEASKTLASAQEAVSTFDAEHAEAERALAEKKAECENFLLWNVECYSMLRDKTRVSRGSDATVTVEVSKAEATEDGALASPAVIGA